MTAWAIIRTRFIGMHHWPTAPEGRHVHLRNPHRHEFHVEVWVEQEHDDRDVEYLDAKDRIDAFIADWPFDLGHKSCEMMAREILSWLPDAFGLRVYRCGVFEDGENGAMVE
jgi:hypothetical protein